MYFRKTCFLPCWLFVSFWIWWNVWGRARDWNKSSWKGETGKKKVAKYIRNHVVFIEMCVTSWQSQAVSGSQNVRERVTSSHEYTWLTLVMWLAPTAQDKIKGVGVVVSINPVTFLTNRFTNVHHLCFGNKWISILFSRIFLYHGHFKNIGV